MIEFKSFASGSSGNMYTVDDGTTKIMIEAGINIKRIKKALNFQVTHLAGALISHSHGDHNSAVKDVLDLGVNCHMSKVTAEETGVNHHRVKIFESLKPFKIGTLMILPFPVQHDVENHGFLIQSDQGERLLFLTDSYYCKYKFENLNYIAIECNYSQKILQENVESGRVPEFLMNRVMQSHFSLENLLVFLKANDLSRVQEIHLLHLSDSNSNEIEFKQAVQAATGKLVYVA